MSSCQYWTLPRYKSLTTDAQVSQHEYIGKKPDLLRYLSQRHMRRAIVGKLHLSKELCQKIDVVDIEKDDEKGVATLRLR